MSQRKRVHAQALAKRSSEQLASELIVAKETITRMQDEARIMATEKRRLQAQLLLARSNVTKAEELLNNRQRCATWLLSNCCTVSCLHLSNTAFIVIINHARAVCCAGS
jgi:hypothetical protein